MGDACLLVQSACPAGDGDDHGGGMGRVQRCAAAVGRIVAVVHTACLDFFVQHNIDWLAFIFFPCSLSFLYFFPSSCALFPLSAGAVCVHEAVVRRHVGELFNRHKQTLRLLCTI